MKTVKTTILLAILVFININTSNASSIEKETKIAENALIKYLNAGDKSNTVELEKLMHKNYRVIFKDTKKDEVSEITRQSYLNFIDKKIFGGEKRTIKLIKGKMQGGTIASFEVITNSEAGTMTSFYSLVKENGMWLVLQDLVYM